MQYALLLLCVKLPRRMGSTISSTPYWTRVHPQGDFSSTTEADKTGYKLWVHHQGSSARNDNSSRLLDFVRFRKLRITESDISVQICNSELGIEKLVFANTRCRILQNYMVFQSEVFFPTGHKVVTTLNLRINSTRITRSKYTTLHLEKLNGSIHVPTNMQWQSQVNAMCSASLGTL